MRSMLLASALLASACGAADAASAPRGLPLASSIIVTPAARVTPPLPTPSFVPGASFIGGQVAAVSLPFVTLRTVTGGEVAVDLSRVRSVWRETWVTASALRVGDDLFIDGSRTALGFVATNVNANIGRLDGRILSITDGVLDLALLRDPNITFTAELSPFIVHEGPWRLADLHPGMTIGAVVYWDRIGPRRITRIWIW